MAEKLASIKGKTSFGRLAFGLVFGNICLLIALMTPGIMLLPFKVMEIDPKGFTTSYGLITGISALFALIAQPVGGAISDRTNISFGRRRTWILIGSLGGGLSLLWIASASTVWQVLIATCLTQMFFNFAGVAFNALIPDQVSVEKQGTISGIYGLGMPIGMFVGMGILTTMNAAPSFSKWLVLLIIGIVGPFISALFFIREGKVEIEKAKVEKPSIKERLNHFYPSPRKHPAFTWAIISKFLLMMGYFSVTYLSIMLVSRLGFSTEKAQSLIGPINMLGLVGSALASVLGGILSDKMKKQKPFLIISAIMIIAGLLVLAFIPNLIAVFVGVVILNLALGSFTAVDTALVSRILPNKLDASKDFGILNIANTLPQTIIPALAPLLLHVGGWIFFYLFLVACVIFSIFAIRALPEIGQSNNVTELENKVLA
ncbi:MFS transporter [Neobacillus sp. 3P2-tot-E-2]|uniref:MFS transporter n=1 Tax=Neobacillus sp. 3P2-tot-E-2 TaxID=3132212 RepID=UPI00399FFE9D